VNTELHFSSKTPEWSTPTAFYDKLVAEFGPFTLDPCATKDNAKAQLYFTKEIDGLRQPWAPHRVFLNPPYGRGIIGRWMGKAVCESNIGAFIVCLVPARTDTAWWHDFAMKGKIRFIKGRLKFGGGEIWCSVPICAGYTWQKQSQ